jgi:protein ImuB
VPSRVCQSRLASRCQVVMPRFAAIVFSGLAVSIARGLHMGPTSDASVPLAVVMGRPSRQGGAADEASLLGNTRLSEVSPEARALGVRAGQTIAAAKARASDLRVRVVSRAAVQAVLMSVADMAFSFGATTAFESGVAGDVVWVDVTGCAHLHASTEDPDGERSLGEALTRAVLAMGHDCRVAIADGAKVAAAVARFARQDCSPTFRPSALPVNLSPFVVPMHGNARVMGRLPLAALGVFGLSEGVISWLEKLGARKVADVQRLPRAALAARLDHDAPRVMAILEGDDRSPLTPHVPPERPLERAVLEYGITHHEALFFVIKRLCDRLALRLEGRVSKAQKLLLRLEVDHAVSGAPAKDPVLPLTLASPLVKADELFTVVKAKVLSPDGAAHIAIEWEENGSGDVPILAVSLEVTEEVAASPVPQHLFVPEARAERALPRLIAELSAELGPHAVGVLSLSDTWVTTERSRLVPYRHGEPGARRVSPPLVSAGEEMTRLLPEPVPVSRRALSQVRLLARSEEVEWWKPSPAPHDAFIAFFSDRATRGTAWVSIDRRTGEAFIQGWLD